MVVLASKIVNAEDIPSELRKAADVLEKGIAGFRGLKVRIKFEYEALGWTQEE